LNRNYATDWGVGVLTQVGLVNDFNFDENGQISVKDNLVQQPEKNLIDECADACSECYRGPEPFSEPETKALRTFLNEHQKQIKFVYNFHSNGNMWIYPYNGRVDNDIETRNPGILPIF
jgi:hypothetical protein